MVRSRRTPLLLAVFAFGVYLTNLRPMGLGDTIPARLLPFSILRQGNLDLDEFEWLRSNGAEPYFLKRDAAGHWRSKYPVATPCLMTPLAWPFVWLARGHGIDDGDARFRLLTVVFERLAAALLAAASVALVLMAARRVASPPWAAAGALVYAFGTNTWVNSSQALWQHGLVELGFAGAILCLLRAGGRRNALLAGACVGLSLAARPTSVLVAAVLALYFWRERRADSRYFLAPLAAVAVALLWYNIGTLSQPTGGYTTSRLTLPSPERLFGLLVSPSRGLLVYCPLALLACGALSRRTHPSLLRYLAAAPLAYVAFYSGFTLWWGGHSYGPRFFTDVMPLVAICAVAVAQRSCSNGGRRMLLLAGALWCVGVQVIGVYFDDNGWNRRPANIDNEAARLWDWSDPQILRAARSAWHGWDLAPLLRQLVTDPRPALLVPLEPAALAGSIEAEMSTPWRFEAGRGGVMDIRVTNQSDGTVWPAFSDWGPLDVGVLAYWRSGETVQQAIGGFIPFRRHLGPGDREHVREWIAAPAGAGTYDLELAIVQNLDGAGRYGGASLTVPVVVE